MTGDATVGRQRRPALHFRGKVLLAWTIVLLGVFGLSLSGFIAADRSVTSELTRARAELSESTLAVVDQLEAISAPGIAQESLWATGGALLDLQLAERSAVEGGVWSPGHGFVAYVFPTYGGNKPKTQLPGAELPSIRALSERAIASGALEFDTVVGEREALVRAAKSLANASPELAVWTMKRVPIQSARVLTNGAIAAACLLLVIVAVGLWLAWFLSRWSTALHQMQSALTVRPLEDIPTVSNFGAHELREIGDAVNALTADLRGARAHAASLVTRLGSAERLAAVGRVSAALAHEIRNPIATIRLRAENALAGTSPTDALSRILEEVERLERLTRSLLELGREIQLRIEEVDIPAWSEKILESARPRAQTAQVRIESRVTVSSWQFDPVHLARAADGLLANAIQFSPPGSTVNFTLDADAENLLLQVADEGAGIPADIEQRIFEPFFTTRAGGTGLGLALVREIVEAHGGAVEIVHTRRGACFQVRIPCPESS